MVEYNVSDFYCINCGHKGIPIPRRRSYQYKPLHRKRMYCPNCKHTVNHIECRNAKEAETFLTCFRNGDFQAEAASELEYEKMHPSLSIFLKMDKRSII